MTDIVVEILIVLGVIVLLATINKLFANVFNKRKKLEEELEELYCSYEAEEEAAENNFFKIKNYIKSSNEVLVDTYNFACNLYEERKILIEYAKICITLDATNYKDLSDETRQQIKEIIQKHNKFLETQK